MNKLLMTVLACLFVSSYALAETTASNCEAQAVSKDGKPLAGAAKAAFIKKCEKGNEANSCAAKAIGKNGKPLAGAAKAAFIKKCEKDAAGQ